MKFNTAKAELLLYMKFPHVVINDLKGID